MKSSKGVFSLKEVQKGVVICLKITLVFGTFFMLINQQFTLKGIALTYFPAPQIIAIVKPTKPSMV